MKYKFVLIILFLFFVAACSSDDDNPTEPNNNDSFITGNWEAEGFTTNGSDIDSISINVNLEGNNGTFTGNGTIKFGGKNLNSEYYGVFTDEIKGTYSANSIALTAKNNVTGDTFAFAGNITDNQSFSGLSTIVISGTTYTYSTTLFKKE